MKTLSNIGCFLIGWNKNILKECGEASYRQFRKLLSALCIMMVLWGTIGYCFADRYINIESCLLKICVALAFMFIVLCVERVIILTVGKARMMSFMRVLLALCMAILGSCIFDQIIFRNDIQQAIQEHREDIIKVTITKRLSIYDSDIQRITHEMDSLSKATIILGEELQKWYRVNRKVLLTEILNRVNTRNTSLRTLAKEIGVSTHLLYKCYKRKDNFFVRQRTAIKLWRYFGENVIIRK